MTTNQGCFDKLTEKSKKNKLKLTCYDIMKKSGKYYNV
jgi:hypothetical protein